MCGLFGVSVHFMSTLFQSMDEDGFVSPGLFKKKYV